MDLDRDLEEGNLEVDIVMDCTEDKVLADTVDEVQLGTEVPICRQFQVVVVAEVVKVHVAFGMDWEGQYCHLVVSGQTLVMVVQELLDY